MIEKGKFKLKGTTVLPELRIISMGAQAVVAQFFAENGKLTLEADADSLNNTKVIGSKSNDEFSILKQELKNIAKTTAFTLMSANAGSYPFEWATTVAAIAKSGMYRFDISTLLYVNDPGATGILGLYLNYTDQSGSYQDVLLNGSTTTNIIESPRSIQLATVYGLTTKKVRWGISKPIYAISGSNVGYSWFKDTAMTVTASLYTVASVELLSGSA